MNTAPNVLTDVQKLEAKVSVLELQVQSFKAALSSASVRAVQAEAIAGRLMDQKLEPHQLQALTLTIVSHMNVLAKERAVQLQSILETTLVALNSGASLEGPALKTHMIGVVKSLSLALAPVQTPTV